MPAQNKKCRILLVLSAFRLLGFLRSHTPRAIVLVRNINHPDICRTIVNTCIPPRSIAAASILSRFVCVHIGKCAESGLWKPTTTPEADARGFHDTPFADIPYPQALSSRLLLCYNGRGGTA